MFINFGLIAQTDCKHGVLTDHENPSNLNSLPLIQNGEDLRFMNGFDWFPIGLPGTPDEGYYLGYNLSNMDFSGTPILSMSSIMNNQGSLPYYNYLYEGPLPITENGWELLLVNIGRFPNDTDVIPQSVNALKSFPYIVIYNKYLGKIRVFCKFGLDLTVHAAADAIEISIKFNNILHTSGLMRMYDSNEKALDKTSNIVQMSSVTKAQNFASKWYSTDFQIAYDPCTCYYPSELSLNFSQIKQSTVIAHSRTIELDDQDLISNSNLTLNPADWLTGFNYTGQTANGGIAIAKSLDIMTKRYIGELEKYKTDLEANQIYNDEVKRKLAIMQLFEKIIIEGGSSAISALTQLPFWATIEAKAEELLKTDVVDTEALKKEANKLLASGVKGLKTLVAGEFKSIPEKPEMPTATFSETKYSGQITQKSDYAGPVFFNPGTYGSNGTGTPTLNSPYAYPVYNEVLGTFALLESPKIKITKAVLNDFGFTLDQKTYLTQYSQLIVDLQRYMQSSTTYKIELVEPLKFAINDVLKIKSYNINAGYSIKATRMEFQRPNNIRVEAYHDSPRCVNSIFTNSNVNNYGKIYGGNYQYGFLQNYNDLSQDGSWNPEPSLSVDNSHLHIETPFLPIDAFMPFEVTFGLKNEAISHSQTWLPFNDLDLYGVNVMMDNNGKYIVLNPTNTNIEQPIWLPSDELGFYYKLDVTIKLIVEIEFEDKGLNGKNHSVTEVHSYLISDSEIETINLNNVNWSSIQVQDIMQFPEFLKFHDTDFDGRTVKGCVINGNKYVCRARNKITIDGDLRADTSPYNYYDVEMIADKEIIIEPESNISGEIVLNIKPFLDYSQPMPKATAEQVGFFCNNTTGKYKANTASSAIFEYAELMKNEIVFREIVEEKVLIYPNPSNGDFFVSLANLTIPKSVSLYDAIGREIQCDFRLESDRIRVMTNNLSNGIYRIKVLTFDELYFSNIYIFGK